MPLAVPSPLASGADLAARIDAALPQTQCQRCGFADCAGYAQAVARGEAPINRCPPGGDQGVARLAVLTGQPIIALDPAHGLEGPRSVAVIDEDWCIGCTLCIKACPTDAILGLNKRMHTVIPEHCTGCELCVPACPVDCIRMENASGQASGWAAWSVQQADQARTRYHLRSQRLAREDEKQAAPPSTGAAPESGAKPAPDAKQAAIAAALARARAQRATVA
jgi:electron transport complex protein RnfB